ncbi:hypothetical protein BD769DRAFT_1642424 [Suillus cothurnatus]|nr:hypothetical protein BD769DRAFT_1642424 [Suillus cothurnatus]
MYARRFRCWSLKSCKRYPRRSLKLLNSVHVTTRGTGLWQRPWTFVLDGESCANVGVGRLISPQLTNKTPQPTTTSLFMLIMGAQMLAQRQWTCRIR